MSFYIKIKTKNSEEILLETLRSYYDVDKFASMFLSSKTLMYKLHNRESLKSLAVYNNDKEMKVKTGISRVLTSVYDNKKTNELLDSITSSIFTEPTKSIDFYTFKDYLREEKLRFSKDKKYYSEQKCKLINEIYRLLNYGNMDNEKEKFRILLGNLINSNSYYEVRHLYTIITKFGFIFDDSFDKLMFGIKEEIDEKEKQNKIDEYNKKIDRHFNNRKQITFGDLETEEVKEEIKSVFNYNGEKIDEIPFYIETEEKKVLNLRG